MEKSYGNKNSNINKEEEAQISAYFKEKRCDLNRQVKEFKDNLQINTKLVIPVDSEVEEKDENYKKPYILQEINMDNLEVIYNVLVLKPTYANAKDEIVIFIPKSDLEKQVLAIRIVNDTTFQYVHFTNKPLNKKHLVDLKNKEIGKNLYSYVDVAIPIPVLLKNDISIFKLDLESLEFPTYENIIKILLKNDSDDKEARNKYFIESLVNKNAVLGERDLKLLLKLKFHSEITLEKVPIHYYINEKYLRAYSNKRLINLYRGEDSFKTSDYTKLEITKIAGAKKYIELRESNTIIPTRYSTVSKYNESILIFPEKFDFTSFMKSTKTISNNKIVTKSIYCIVEGEEDVKIAFQNVVEENEMPSCLKFSLEELEAIFADGYYILEN
ncbi:MAG: hypothetical protein RSE00_00005 [Clostridia bacterium]